jgi:L-rhamnose mutarotase
VKINNLIMIVIIFCSLFGFQCSKKTNPPQRYANVVALKQEKIDYYKQLHAKAWPGVLKMIKESNIQNYSIYFKKIDENMYLLFSYFEYTGNDFKADMEKMSKDPESQRWWKETGPCQIPIPNHAEGELWSQMEEIFRLD